jgi:hypothetical protein
MKMTEQEQVKALRKAKRDWHNISVIIKHYSLGYYLEYICSYSKVSQRALGRILGSTSSAYVANIIAGRKKMGMERKTKLAEVLKLNKAEKNALYEAV